MTVSTTVFGYPRIGPQRELKKALEFYWDSKASAEELLSVSESLILNNAKTIHDHGIDIIPSNEFSLYDFILDHSFMFNVIPGRFRGISNPLERYFSLARGKDTLPASEMTKWFNTNYHYIVPEIEDNSFYLTENKPLKEYNLIKEKLGLKTKPVIVGPYTFLKSAKIDDKCIMDAIAYLTPVYIKLIKELEENEVENIQIDEPAFVLDLSKEVLNSIVKVYNEIAIHTSAKIFIHSFYEQISNYEEIIFLLPAHGFGFDLVGGTDNLDNIQKYGFPSGKVLVAGVVSGRDPWKVDYEETIKIIEKISKVTDNIIIANSSPLMHLPVTVKAEKGHLSEELLNMCSFANEKLREIVTLKLIINDGLPVPNQNVYLQKESFTNQKVRKKLSILDEENIERTPDFNERYARQMKILNLPHFPTTTIGSFPQTDELRKIRADHRAGRTTDDEYQKFINGEIEKAIRFQEEISLDVLVHGEFERTDMVEFFALKMQGFAVTRNGWVQSYGSRCVKPPIIYGDISRDKPLILKETLYAQSLTEKPVKAILTGPVTILQWSYQRNDIPKKEIAFQIALALEEEVLDLETKGIKVIQIDEPAFREGLPLKKEKHKEYFDWAIKSFKIITKNIKPETQIHTHMCYSDFNEIIDKIYALQSDVVSIEASRSKGEILSAFEKFNYDHAIGIGIYDIHSPRVPSVDEMLEISRRSIKLIDKNLFWINPDCGLKTRKWQETILCLKNMVKVAEILRKESQDV